jgi:hypothetical protein
VLLGECNSTFTNAPGLSATSNEAAGTYGSSGVDAVVDDATLCERLRALLRPLLSAAFCSDSENRQKVQKTVHSRHVYAVKHR